MTPEINMVDHAIRVARETAAALGRSPVEPGTLRLADAIRHPLDPIGPHYRPVAFAHRDTKAAVLAARTWTINHENATADMIDLARNLVEAAATEHAEAARKCAGPYRDPGTFAAMRRSAFDHADAARACLSCLHRLGDFYRWCCAVRSELPEPAMRIGFDPLRETRYLASSAVAFLVGETPLARGIYLRDTFREDGGDPPASDESTDDDQT